MTTTDKITACLTWRGCNQHLSTLEEKDVKRVLDRAVKAKASKQIITRVHARYCKLRNARELRVALNKAK